MSVARTNPTHFNIIQLPYKPPKVRLQDLIEEDGKLFLLSINERKKILNELDCLPDGRYGGRKDREEETKEFGFPQFSTNYSLLKCEGRNYVIYFGQSKNLHAGHGTFGVVKYAQDLETGEWIAVKIFSRPHMEINIKEKKIDSNYVREITNKEMLGLQYVNKLKGSIFSRFSPNKFMQHYLLMKLEKGVEGINFLIQCHNANFPIVKYLEIMKSWCKHTLKLSEKFGILHRDIKIENILIDPSSLHVKYIDFGMAVKLPQDDSGKPIKAGMVQDKKAVGTFDSVAPEVIFKHQYSVASDLFALGSNLARMFLLRDEELLNFGFDMLEQKGLHIFLVKPSSAQYLHHPFLTDPIIKEKIYFLISRLLKADPNERIDIKELLSLIDSLINTVHPSTHTVKVGFISLESYANAHGGQKKNIHENMQKFDEIYLIDTNHERSLMERMQLREELESVHVVMDKIFVGTNFNITCREAEENIKLYNPTGRIYQFSVIRQTNPEIQQRINFFNEQTQDEDDASFDAVKGLSSRI